MLEKALAAIDYSRGSEWHSSFAIDHAMLARGCAANKPGQLSYTNAINSRTLASPFTIS